MTFRARRLRIVSEVQRRATGEMPRPRWSHWLLFLLVVAVLPTQTGASDECRLLSAFGSCSFSNTVFIFSVHSTKDLLLTSLSISFFSIEEGGITTWNGTAHERFGYVAFKPSGIDNSPAWLNSGFRPVELDRSTPRQHVQGLPTLRFARPVLLRANQVSTLLVSGGSQGRGVRCAAARRASARRGNQRFSAPNQLRPSHPTPRAGTWPCRTTTGGYRPTGGPSRTAPSRSSQASRHSTAEGARAPRHPHAPQPGRQPRSLLPDGCCQTRACAPPCTQAPHVQPPLAVLQRIHLILRPPAVAGAPGAPARPAAAAEPAPEPAGPRPPAPAAAAAAPRLPAPWVRQPHHFWPRPHGHRRHLGGAVRSRRGPVRGHRRRDGQHGLPQGGGGGPSAGGPGGAGRMLHGL